MTEKNINAFINDSIIDYEEARKVINGIDQKDLIASYAKKFQSILEKCSSLPRGC